MPLALALDLNRALALPHAHALPPRASGTLPAYNGWESFRVNEVDGYLVSRAFEPARIQDRLFEKLGSLAQEIESIKIYRRIDSNNNFVEDFHPFANTRRQETMRNLSKLPMPALFPPAP
ncbi:hypothetical protein BDY24DRAFT_435589 [Mrakia frigida]|uniref:uncharacterized protein n=1 Tax=Mrakia frigida TaxID=29902 RepID=UPI003FCC0C2F